MSARTVLFGLLAVVATAAAVLSFAALRDLALLCGFAPQLAWLLPVVVDAGAGAGSLVWLGGTVAGSARRFARALALTLLGMSVAANALDHGLDAYALAPAWWVVVLVSAIAPAVLGAVVHLAVLVGRDPRPDIDDEPIRYELTPEAVETVETVDERGLSRLWDDAPPTDRASALIAAGAGRRRLSRELDITEHEARRLLADARAVPADPAPESAAVLTGAPFMNLDALLVFTITAVVAAIAWRRGARLIAVGFGLFSLLPAVNFVRSVPVWLLFVLAAPAGLWLWHRHGRTSTTVVRWSARSRRKSGVASTTDILRVASGRAMRRRAGTVRPSLAPTGRWARWSGGGPARTTDVAVQLCRAGLLTVWASIEDVICIFGGPRTGKSQWLAGRILDAAGAVLVTSTRMDLYSLTAPLRRLLGPVYVFNPVGLAGMASTITFDPLTGCANPVTAAERAADLLAAGAMTGGAAEREFWESQARRVLTAFLHAAALGTDLTMRHVQRWVVDPDEAKREVTSLLRKSPEAALLEDAKQFLTTNDRTRSSITSTIMPALGWLTHDAAVAAATGPRTGGEGFDVAELLANRATVYLLGAEETQTAPLVSALTGHIAREARRIAAHQPGGRLDPNLTLALDEAALICPVPLHQWTADMGGRGVTIIAAFQSRAQVLDRYGEAKAEVILNNSAAVMVFGGTRSREDLTYWSTLGGERDEPTLTTDMHGRVASRTTRRVPVLSPAQIANLPAEMVVAFRRGMPPVIGRVQMAYRRSDIRAQFFPEAFDVRTRARILTVLAWFAARVTRPVRAWLLAHIGTPLARWFAHAWAWLAGVARWVLVALRLRRPAPPAVDLVKATPLSALPPWLPEDDDDSDERWMP